MEIKKIMAENSISVREAEKLTTTDMNKREVPRVTNQRVRPELKVIYNKPTFEYQLTVERTRTQTKDRSYLGLVQQIPFQDSSKSMSGNEVSENEEDRIRFEKKELNRKIDCENREKRSSTIKKYYQRFNIREYELTKEKRDIALTKKVPEEKEDDYQDINNNNLIN